MTASEIAGIFDAKPGGSGFMGLCPAHDDHTPSLSITEGNDGYVLLHCFAGCNTTDVLAAKGLTMADLMPTQPERTMGGLGPVEVSYDDGASEKKLHGTTGTVKLRLKTNEKRR